MSQARNHGRVIVDQEPGPVVARVEWVDMGIGLGQVRECRTQEETASAMAEYGSNSHAVLGKVRHYGEQMTRDATVAIA
jgi:hypothetical protein